MIRLLSFKSLLKIPEVKERVVNEIGLLSREHDQWIKDYLYALGMQVSRDERKPTEIQVGKHRDLDGNINVGYFYLGMERRDREWRESKYCTLSAYIEGNSDGELKSDMYNASREGIGAAGFEAMCLNAIGDSMSNRKEPEENEKDYEQTLAYINQLRDIQLHVRGYIEKYE